ncbi:MAG: glycoside hydrolase family 2 [Bacteroidales bacterium]|nr:glycoside hydrolase family 2 [Bacteroidales bacterium]
MNFTACRQKIYNGIQPGNFARNWELFSSESVNADGKTISSSGFKVENGYEVEVPATVMAALVRNEVYKDIFFSDNLKYVSDKPFKIPWWYRKTFHIDSRTDSEYFTLVFEGLNYKANIWLNGLKIGAADSVRGCFRMFDFDVTPYIHTGENTLAVEIYPPEWGDLTIGFVDWNPWPPDNNMGLWRPVKLLKTGKVALKNVFVKPSLNTETLKEARLDVSADLVNHSDDVLTGQVEVQLEELNIRQDFSIDPHELKTIVFSPADYPGLILRNPRIWWPNNLGDPSLYQMRIKVIQDSAASDERSVRFGIRDVTEYFNENGHRGFMINGEKLLVKGAGWTDDMFLDDTDEKVKNQIRYVKHMNLNTIRLEGFWGRNEKLYDFADENGILIMIGWSCQWEWEPYCGRTEDEYLAIRTPEEISEHARAYQDQLEWLRNHPSVFLWIYGSDKLVVPELENRLNGIIAAKDGTRPVLGSCGSAVSQVTGPSGVKMNGPYGYVTPNYWYVDEKKGGAFGFNTETGPGIQPSPAESIKKMISSDHLWPIDSIWEFHLGRREFTTFRHWMKPFNARYGPENNVESFSFKAQMANYEAMRPMFEAFHINRPNSTGIIQWMLNSAFPNMLWQLFDWYLMPNGAFYGAKNGCRPLNIIYNYKDRGIYLSNDYHHDFSDLSAEISIFNTSGKEVFSKSLKAIIGKNQPVKIFEIPELRNHTTTYFLDLRLKGNKGEPEAINFYWLSTREDILDYDNSEWYLTGNSSYADLTGINSMDEIEIEVKHDFISQGDTLFVRVSLENPTDQLAFFIELILKGKKSGRYILPVFWEDNYISLLPGEKREITGYVFKKDLGTVKPFFSYKGWNIRSK